ncbi:hypothetical protein BgiMline_031313, partial [Biomphalaria glabrata]
MTQNKNAVSQLQNIVMNYFPSLAVIAFVSYFKPKVFQYDYNDPFFNDPFFNDPFFSTLCSG